jgi:hypothetical protein
MAILKERLIQVDGKHGPVYFIGDVIEPEPGSEHDVLTVVPGTLKLVDVQALPRKARAKPAVLAEQTEKANDARIGDPTLTMTPDTAQAKLEELKENSKNDR